MIIDLSKQQKCGYNCIACGVGFHVECFAAYHYPQLTQKHKPAMHKLIKTEVDSYTHGYKKHKCHATIKDLQLPCLYSDKLLKYYNCLHIDKVTL